MFDRLLFGAAIAAHCQQRHISARQAAREAGVSSATLSRLLGVNKTPDMETFGRLCSWLGQSPASFFAESGQAGETLVVSVQTQVVALLRTDMMLPASVREHLADLVAALYQSVTVEEQA